MADAKHIVFGSEPDQLPPTRQPKLVRFDDQKKLGGIGRHDPGGHPVLSGN